MRQNAQARWERSARAGAFPRVLDEFPCTNTISPIARHGPGRLGRVSAGAMCFLEGAMSAKEGGRAKGRSEHKDREHKDREPTAEEAEEALEQALEDTFPSSDPISITQPTVP